MTKKWKHISVLAACLSTAVPLASSVAFASNSSIKRRATLKILYQDISNSKLKEKFQNVKWNKMTSNDFYFIGIDNKTNKNYLRIFEKDSSKNWVFEIKNNLHYSNAISSYANISKKLNTLINEKKHVTHRGIIGMPPITLKKTYFKEYDDVSFKSSWGVRNSDTGRSNWEGELNYSELLGIFASYANKLYHEEISNPRIYLKGLCLQPITWIKNVPFGKANVSYDLSVGNDFNTNWKNINVNLPKGHSKGEEWQAGFKQGITLGIGAIIAAAALILGPAIIEAIYSLAASIGESLAATFVPLAAQEFLVGEVAAAVGRSIAVSMKFGSNDVSAALSTSFLAILNSLGYFEGKKGIHENLNLSSDWLESLIRHHYESLTKDNVKSFVKKTWLKNVNFHTHQEMVDKFNEFKSKATYFWVGKNINRNQIVNINSILYGTAKATSLFGDQTTFSMEGINAVADFNFYYDNIAYSNIKANEIYNLV